MFTDERNEPAAADDLADKLIAVLVIDDQILDGAAADRRDQHAAGLELGGERRRNGWNRGGQEDAVELDGLRPATGTIADGEFDINDTKFFQGGLGLFGQFVVAFDGEDPASQSGQDGRLVAAAGADFENIAIAGNSETLGHQCDDVRLADGLAQADRQWMIGVGLGAIGLREEILSRDPTHDLQNGRVADVAALEMMPHHLCPLEGELILFIKADHRYNRFSFGFSLNGSQL